MAVTDAETDLSSELGRLVMLMGEAESCRAGGKLDRARTLYFDAAAALRRITNGDLDTRDKLLCQALSQLGISDFDSGRLEEAHGAFTEALTIARGHGWDALVAYSMYELSLVELERKRLPEALRWCTQAIALKAPGCYATINKGFARYQEYDMNQLATELAHLAIVLQAQGRFAAAKQLLTILRANAERTYNLDLLTRTLYELGGVNFALSCYYEGVDNFVAALQLSVRLRQPRRHELIVNNLKQALATHRGWLEDPRILPLLQRLAR